MQKTINYFGKQVTVTYEKGYERSLGELEELQEKQDQYNAKRANFVSGVQGVDKELPEGKKYTKERSYDKEIARFKEALKEQDKLSYGANINLDLINNKFLNITEDFNNIENVQYAGYDAQKKILSDKAISQKEYVDKLPKESLYSKFDFDLKLRVNVPYSLLYQLKYKDIFKTLNDGPNNKCDKYSNVRLGNKNDPFYKHLLEVVNDLDKMDMIDDTNIKYEEAVKRYAGRKLFETRAEITNFFVPDPKIYDTEEKVNEFYKQKATEYDYIQMQEYSRNYDKAVDEYEKVKEKCDKYFSKTGHCTNIDVLRESKADALITENTHSSSVLSSVFTILKAYKQLEKDKLNNSLEDFLMNPAKVFKPIMDNEGKSFSNSLLQNLGNRGEVLAKLDEMSRADTYDSAGFMSVAERLEECFLTINPNDEYSINASLNIMMPIQKYGSFTRRAQQLFRQENFNKVFNQLSIMTNDDYAPEKIGFESYFDYENNKYYEVPDSDTYIRDKKINFKDIYDRATDLVFQYNNALENGINNHGIGDVIVSCQNLAMEMYTKHFDEMDSKMQKKFKALANNPVKVLNDFGLGCNIPIPQLNQGIEKFNEKAQLMDDINKELPIYEKFVVEKENQFNKEYIKLDKEIATATKKNDTAKLQQLKEQQEAMKAKRITTLIRDYNSGKLPESYAVNRIQNILNGDMKDIKGIFRASGYSNAKSYCKANGLTDLTKEEMEQVYQSALDEKSAYIQERSGVIEATEKIDIMAELQRHDQPEITKKVVEGLKEDLERNDLETNKSKSLELYANKEKKVENSLGK